MLKTIKNKYFLYYLYCKPSNKGSEDLHQLADELRNNGFEVYMHYLNQNKKENYSPVHKEYLHFKLPHTEEIIDDSKNIIISPETFITFYGKEYSNLQKAIWWLSITNYFVSLKSITDFYKNKNLYFVKKIF